ncbi:MAG: hypothetical protein LJE58_11985 [Thiogranum sp.]|jgi:thiamine phosphate synthase YjbQ (UPF0047 family)|nr:hypothetical protein [Thiogranum sp.]
MLIKYHDLQLSTGDGIGVHDVTPQIASYVADSGISNGFGSKWGRSKKLPSFSIPKEEGG